MRTTIDRAGRIVVPKAIRERLRLGGGGEVEIIERDGVIEIAPAPVATTMRESEHGPVLDAVDPIVPLTDEVVRAAIDASRR